MSTSGGAVGVPLWAAVTTAPGAAPGTTLVAGTYTLSLETDCPGESHLWAWRYIDAAA